MDTTEHMQAYLGQLLPHYQVLQPIRLSKGNPIAIWLAQSKVTREPVAIKLVRPQVRNNARSWGETRLNAEIDFLRQFGRVPAIVRLIESSHRHQPPIAVLEYLEEIPLPPDWRQLVRLSVPLVRNTLARLHHLGAVHADLKPSNIILTDRGFRLIDFGISRVLVPSQHSHRDKGSRTAEPTATDSTLGTPQYAPPEKINDTTTSTIGTTPAADVYSIGATLYAWIAGRPPFRGNSTSGIVRLRRRQPHAPHLLRSGTTLRVQIPDDLGHIVMSCLTVEPEKRPTALQLADQLQSLLVPLPARG